VTPRAPRTVPLFLGVLLCGALGQVFLARAGTPWTLPVGCLFYGLSFFLLAKVLPVEKVPDPGPVPSQRWEAFLFLPVLLLAVHFRSFGEAPLPDGVFADRAEVALGALRILHEGWHPGLSALDLHVPELPIYYLVAGWFQLFGSDPKAFSLFDATLSLLGVVGFYRFFRQTSGPWAALGAFFLLACMRWNFVFGRQVYFQVQTVLFTALALLFLQRAFLTGGRGFAMAGGAVAALGLYSYQALKALPLFLLVWTLYEALADRASFRSQKGTWLAFWACFLLVASPYLVHGLESGGLGRREAEVTVLVKVREQGSLRPLFQNIVEAAGMFNRRGDDNSQSNFDARRMLDDGTGVLFLLGLFHAVRRWRERPYFLALAGLVVFSLPAVLSINGAHAGRMLGTTPFVAWLGALLLRDVIASLAGRAWKVAFLLGGILALGIALQNHVQYFHGQALDQDYRSDFSWSESQVGRAAASEGVGTEIFLPSRFLGHPTVRYLSLQGEADFHPLDLSRPPRPGEYPKDRAFLFFLDERKAGVLEYLKALYPGGEDRAYQAPNGSTPLYAYRVGPEALSRSGPSGPRTERGLKGTYRVEGDPRPLERWDPVLNFTFRDLPGMPRPLEVDWQGRLKVEKAGRYSIFLLTYEDERLNLARVRVEGKGETPWMACPKLETDLTVGWHGLEIGYRKPEAPLATVNLLWKGPGMERYEFISNSVLGPIREKATE
jgi:hypothetical protein